MGVLQILFDDLRTMRRWEQWVEGKKDAGKSAPLGGPRAGYGGGGAGGGQGRTVLTMEDLGMAVGEYGVNVKRGEFYR